MRVGLPWTGPCRQGLERIGPLGSLPGCNGLPWFGRVRPGREWGGWFGLNWCVQARNGTVRRGLYCAVAVRSGAIGLILVWCVVLAVRTGLVRYVSGLDRDDWLDLGVGRTGLSWAGSVCFGLDWIVVVGSRPIGLTWNGPIWCDAVRAGSCG